jgi:hypothetical protein
LPLEESAKLGADYFGLVASTEDFKEGTGAFLNKKKPSSAKIRKNFLMTLVSKGLEAFPVLQELNLKF